MEWIKSALEERKRVSMYRSLKDACHLADFASNNYLGLSAERNGSRLLTGELTAKSEIESWIANWFDAEACLILQSGYQANLALLSCIVDREDVIVYDKLCHASIRDGIRLSSCKAYGFAHNDLQDLSKKLKLAGRRTFVVVESVYSMDGDTADLQVICDLCEEHGALLIVDEAHATGVIGSGRGLIHSLGLQNRCFARTVTFSKGVGRHGGAVLSSELLREYLINFSRPFIYTTAPSLQFFQAIKESLEQITEDRLQKIQSNIEFFHKSLKAIGLTYTGGETGVFGVLVPGNSECREAAKNLNIAGYDIRPILSPTVPEGTERLRICIHANHTKDQLKQLIDELHTF